MKRVSIVGLDTVKEDLISRLMDLGAVQIDDATGRLQQEEWSAIGERDGNEDQAVSLDAYANRVNNAIETLEANCEIKKPLFRTRREMSMKEFRKVLENREAIEDNVEYILSQNAKLHALQDRINKAGTDLTMLGPWLEYDLPLELKETGSVDILTGFVPVTADLEEIRKAVMETDENAILKEVSRDREMIYLAIIALKAEDEQADVASALKLLGFSPMPFAGMKGTAKANSERLSGEIATMEAEAEAVRKEISTHGDMIKDMECLRDEVVMERDRQRVKSRLIRTSRTFSAEGWVPEPAMKKVTDILEEEGCYYEFRDPEEGEEPPVLLKTSAFANPFTAVTEMYSLPDYNGFDPTNIFSIFYAFFFGLMLSDAGYGLVLFLVCFIVLKKFNLEGTTRKMIKMFEICGVFTIFWGVMFGGYFGDLIPTWASTVFGKTIEIKPVWFNPMDNPVRLLIWSLVFGVIHLFVAMGIDMYLKIRRGHFWDAIFDEFVWMVVIVGAACWLGGNSISPALVTPGKVLTIIGLVVLLLTGGRHNKGFGKVTGGLANVYNVTSWISDILSYARLLALGLATGVIASVVNLLGSMVGHGFKGAIGLIVIGLIGHVFSMAINVLGAFVHSSRLQYVEFFGKFYEDGGEPFKPFLRDTQYVKLDGEG